MQEKMEINLLHFYLQAIKMIQNKSIIDYYIIDDKYHLKKLNNLHKKMILVLWKQVQKPIITQIKYYIPYELLFQMFTKTAEIILFKI